MMRTLNMIAVLAFASLGSAAQDLKAEQVPVKIISEFQKSYPKVTNMEWEMKETYYEVEFDIGKYDHEISYDNEGKVVKERIEVSPSELPAALQELIKNKYPDYTIDEVEMTRMQGKISYKVEIDQGWFKERKLVIDHTGKLISDIED